MNCHADIGESIYKINYIYANEIIGLKIWNCFAINAEILLSLRTGNQLALTNFCI